MRLSLIIVGAAILAAASAAAASETEPDNASPAGALHGPVSGTVK